MRRQAATLAFIALIPFQALASQVLARPITVQSPGIVIAPLRKLAAQWTAQTGQEVVVKGGNVKSVSEAVASGAPDDVVLLPVTNLDGLATDVTRDSRRPVGRVAFGVVAKEGTPHPDIATETKFTRFVQSAGALAFSDPATGSLSGTIVAKMLARPQFKGARPLPSKGMVGEAIVRGDATFGVGAISEALMTSGAEVVGRIPDSLEMHIDIDGAILKAAPSPVQATMFLNYITGAEAQAVWGAGGIERIPARRPARSGR